MEKMFMALGVLAVAYAIYSAIVGRVSTWSNRSTSISTYERADSPIKFYIHVATYIALGVVMLVIGFRR
jgi:hypothetical protein